jgi:hypothetical protein
MEFTLPSKVFPCSNFLTMFTESGRIDAAELAS